MISTFSHEMERTFSWSMENMEVFLREMEGVEKVDFSFRVERVEW